jgi:hypothetical protein
MMHGRRPIDCGRLSTVASCTVEPTSNIADAYMAAGTVARSRRSRLMMESGDRLLVDRLGMAGFTLSRRGFQNDIGIVDKTHEMAIQAAQTPGIFSDGQVMPITRSEGMTAIAAGRLDNRGVTAVAAAIIGIGQTVMTAGSSGIRAPLGMTAGTTGDIDNAGVTFGAVARSGRSSAMMLRQSTAGGPAAGGVAAFAAGGFDDAGMTGVATNRDRWVAQQVVVIGTNIGGPGAGGMTIGTTTGARHPCMTYGTVFGLGRCGGMVLVAGITGRPGGIAVAAVTTNGVDHAGMAGVTAERYRRVIQEFMVIGAHIGSPGRCGMATGTIGGTGETVVTGATFKAGSGFRILMMEISGVTTVVAILTATETRHAGMTIGTATVLSRGGGMVLGVSTAGIPGIGIMTVGTTGGIIQSRMTLGTVPGCGSRGIVMLELSRAVSPGVVTAFAIAHHRHGGMAGITFAVVQIGVIVMCDTRIALVAILTAAGAGHRRMTDRTILSLGRCGSMVLVTRIASGPGAVATCAASGFDDAGMAGITADRQRRVVQQFMVIGAHISSPGRRRVATCTLGGAGQTVVTGTTFKARSYLSISVVSHARITALVTIGTGIFRLKGGMASGTGDIACRSQPMVAGAGIAIGSPEGRIMTADTDRLVRCIGVA